MKFKSVRILGLLVVVILLASCGQNSKGEEDVSKDALSNRESMYLGEEIFANLPDKVDCLRYYSFDESTADITDKEVIEKLMLTLKGNNYIQLAEDEYVEGLYDFRFISGDNSVAIGLGEEIIAYDGKQYRLSGDGGILTEDIKKICEK